MADPYSPPYPTDLNGRAGDNVSLSPDPWEPIDLHPYLDGTHVPMNASLLARTDGVGLLYPGQVNELHGESESGKSMMAQYCAARVLGAGGRVLYLDYESDPASIVRRMVELECADSELLERFKYLQPEQNPDGPGWARLTRARIDLVVIDGVNAALATSGVDPMDNYRVTRWGNEVTRPLAARTGAAVLLVDHVTKSGEGRGRFAIGAQAKMSLLTGASYIVDVVTPLAKRRVGRLKLHIAKDRPGGVRGYCGRMTTERTQLAAEVTVDATIPGLISITVDPPSVEQPVIEGRYPAEMERVSLHLQGLTSPVSGFKIRQDVRGRNDRIIAALAALVAEGYLTNEGTEKAGRYVHLLPYRVATDPLLALDPDPDEPSAE